MAKVVDALERSEVQVRYWNKSVRSSTRPPAAEWKPDPERLAMRYEWFRAASAPTLSPGLASAWYRSSNIASGTEVQTRAALASLSSTA